MRQVTSGRAAAGHRFGMEPSRGAEIHEKHEIHGRLTGSLTCVHMHLMLICMPLIIIYMCLMLIGMHLMLITMHFMLITIICVI